MGSNSSRRSGSSGRSKARKRVVIGAQETVRVRYKQNQPHVESERRNNRKKRTPDSNAPSKGAAGHKLANSKRNERERRRQAIRLRRGGVGALALVLVGLIVWGCVAVYNAPIFTIDRVVITGNDRLTRDQVLKLAAIPSETTLVKVPTGAIEQRLATSPWVKSAKLDRDFPHTLGIELVERVPSVVVDQGGANLWLASRDGYWLDKRSAEDTGLVQVNGLAKIAVRPGARIASPEVRNAVKVVEGLSRELRAQIVSIAAPTVEKTALRTADDVEIFVGEATEVAKKDRIAREILKQHPGAVYINVRVPDDPTWRGLQAEPE